MKPIESPLGVAAPNRGETVSLRPVAPAPSRAAERSARLSSLCLRVAQGADVGRFCILGPAPTVVGSSPERELCISDRHVSRAHCEFVVCNGQYVVRDLESTNGTFVEGVRVGEAVVGVGSRIHIGMTELCLDAAAEPADPPTLSATFGDMVGSSATAQRVFALLRSVAGSSLSCLLLGDTGTGKELAARAIHEHSARTGKPFLVVDCASVGAQFIEDKLFGHERGAFTGATNAVAGVFEEARGGTVFLDEIGELPLPLQAKLLGVLERREATRIGSHTPIKLDVRLIAATHRNPAEMSKLGSFRQDLLYRISEFALRIPALRERTEDIPLIARALLEREGQLRVLSEDALQYLKERRWPGNVRELRNVLRRAATLAVGHIIDRELLESLEDVTAEIQLPADFVQSTPIEASGVARPQGISGRPAAGPRARDHVESALDFDLPLAEATEAYRAAYVRELRRRFGDDLNGAATHAGVHPKSVSRLFRTYRAY